MDSQNVTAGSVAIKAFTDEYAYAHTQSGAGGIVAGSGSIATATAKSTTQAYVADNVHLTATGAVEIRATVPWPTSRRLCRGWQDLFARRIRKNSALLHCWHLPIR